MQNISQPSYNQPSQPSGDRILDDCEAVNQAINDLESRHQAFKALTSRILSDRAQLGELEASSSEIMSAYRSLAARMKKIKSNPASGSSRNAPQVGRTDRRLKASIQEFQIIEKDFRAQIKEQQTRQYRIVNPGATEEEVRQAVDDPSTQIFQQALMNADRRGQAQSTLNAVRQRHAAIQNIEKTMIELGQLFEDLNQMVIQDEVKVKQIEDHAVEVQDNIIKGNEELDHGIKSARAARRKKWCLFWMIIIIILVLAAAIVIWAKVTNKF
jgi:syntaxin 1B/2/3